MQIPTEELQRVAHQLETSAADCRTRLDYLRGVLRSLTDDWQSPAGMTFARECHSCFQTIEQTFALPEVLAHDLLSLAERFAAAEHSY